MSSAGIWAEHPVTSSYAEAMVEQVGASPSLVRSLRCPGGTVAVAVATHPEDVSDAVCAAVDAPPVLVAGDLRLHNRDDLAATLGCSGAGGVVALIAAAYARWGMGFAQYLVGDFALALWDRARQTLVLSRDAGGACPLFYSTMLGRIVFASSPRPLISLPGATDQLNERVVVDYLAELPGDEEQTFFASVRRLPPGSSLVAEPRGTRLVRYFDPLQLPERPPATDADCARELRDTLAAAVRCRLPSHGKVAVMLSGGLDSSSVTALAREAWVNDASRIRTISAVFPGLPECDERPYQAAVVGGLRQYHHEVQPDPHGAAGDLDELFRTFWDPSFIGPHWLSWAAMEVAASDGARRMLTGIDGDRVVSHGAGRFGDLAAARDWGGLARELCAVRDFTWSRRLRVGVVQAALALLPEPAVELLERSDPRRGARFRPVKQLLHERIARSHELAERIAAIPIRARSTRVEHARSLLAPDRNWDVELLAQLGNSKGLRFEHPFFDVRVMSLCFSFPGSQKRRGGWSRYVLRNAMRGLVPNLVLDRRTDASFDVAHWQWARRWLAVRPARRSKLDNISPYIHVERLWPLLCDLPTHPRGAPVDLLWKCVILSRWLDAREGSRRANVPLPPSNLGSRGGAVD